jgi:hypothetical protein
MNVLSSTTYARRSAAAGGHPGPGLSRGDDLRGGGRRLGWVVGPRGHPDLLTWREAGLERPGEPQVLPVAQPPLGLPAVPRTAVPDPAGPEAAPDTRYASSNRKPLSTCSILGGPLP